MATLRLFANLRETAGVGSVRIDGDNVGDVLASAVERYGATFAAGLETAQVWVNGDPAQPETAVAESDEIAVIPPVSGGATAAAGDVDLVAIGLVLGLFGALIIGNLASPEAFTVAVVGLGAFWLWDLREMMAGRGRYVAIIPAVLAMAAAANGAYRWGTAGLAGGLAVGVAVVLAWSVVDRRQRTVETISVVALAGLAGSLGAGGAVLLRLRSTAEVATFLAIGGSAATAAWLAQRSTAPAAVDPNVAALVGAIGAGIVSGALAETVDLVNALLAAAIAGGGVIAGRTIGGGIRAGRVYHTVRAPGLLTAYDGPLVAAAVFWIVLELLA